MEMNSAYVFDIDGVLLDVSQRFALAIRLSNGDTKLFWRYFFSEELLKLDRPRKIGVDILLDRISKGTVFIVTGRPNYLRQETLLQLQSIGIPVDRIREIYMRPNNDYRKSCLLKLEAIERIISKGYSILEIHDDEEIFLKRIKRRLIYTKLYLHLDDSFIELSNQYRPFMVD